MEIARFIESGYAAIRGAVPPGIAVDCQSVIWSELGQRGIAEADPATWTEPVVRIPCPEGGPFAQAGMSPAVQDACDQLIGIGRWQRRHGIGGTVPVRFPSEQDPGDAGWHIEASYRTGDQWRVNVHTRERGLLALFLISDVPADGAPTRVRPGSHLDVPPILAPSGEAGLDWAEASHRAAQVSAGRDTVLVTGCAGDVFLCHPFLVHAATWPHRGAFPRMLAQPGVTLLTPYRLVAPEPGGTLPPVERAIMQGQGGHPGPGSHAGRGSGRQV